MTSEQRALINRLYSSKYVSMVTFAQGLLKSKVLAEEAVQETFVIACEKPDDLLRSPNQGGWLINTLKYVIKNMERRRQAAEKVVTDCLGDKLEQLPTPVKNVDLKLLYGNVADTEAFRIMMALGPEGKSMLELARELGVSLDVAKKRAERARKTLQTKIKKYF